MPQATRGRLHYEAAVKVARRARCSVCHRPVFEVARTYVVDTTRGTNLCEDCARDRD